MLAAQTLRSAVRVQSRTFAVSARIACVMAFARARPRPSLSPVQLLLQLDSQGLLHESAELTLAHLA